MKKTNKIIALLTAMVMVLALMAGCGGNGGTTTGGAAGTWKLTTVEVGGQEIAAVTVGMDITMDLKADGSVTMSVSAFGESESTDGTWEQNGDTVSVTVEGDTVEGEVDGDTLTLEGDGETMVFTR